EPKPLGRPPHAGDQLVHRPCRRHHAETGGDHHRGAEAASTVQLHAFADETFALADAAVTGRIAQLLGGEYAGHAIVAPRRTGEAVVPAQGRAHLGGQRVIEGLVQISNLDLRRVDLPAGTTGGDDADLAALAPGDQGGFGGYAVDAVEDKIKLLGDALGH